MPIPIPMGWIPMGKNLNGNSHSRRRPLYVGRRTYYVHIEVYLCITCSQSFVTSIRKQAVCKQVIFLLDPRTCLVLTEVCVLSRVQLRVRYSSIVETYLTSNAPAVVYRSV